MLVEPQAICDDLAQSCGGHFGACSHHLSHDLIRRCREAYAGLHTEEDRLQWIVAELKRRLELPSYVSVLVFVLFFSRAPI